MNKVQMHYILFQKNFRFRPNLLCPPAHLCYPLIFLQYYIICIQYLWDSLEKNHENSSASWTSECTDRRSNLDLNDLLLNVFFACRSSTFHSQRDLNTADDTVKLWYLHSGHCPWAWRLGIFTTSYLIRHGTSGIIRSPPKDRSTLVGASYDMPRVLGTHDNLDTHGKSSMYSLYSLTCIKAIDIGKIPATKIYVGTL